MSEINTILENYNLGAIVVIHTPGYCQHLSRVDPAYSCIKISPDGRLEFRASLQDDFGGNKAALTERVTETIDLLTNLVTVGAQCVIPLAQLKKSVELLMMPEGSAPESPSKIVPDDTGKD